MKSKISTRKSERRSRRKSTRKSVRKSRRKSIMKSRMKSLKKSKKKRKTKIYGGMENSDETPLPQRSRKRGREYIREKVAKSAAEEDKVAKREKDSDEVVESRAKKSKSEKDFFKLSNELSGLEVDGLKIITNNFNKL